MRKFKPVTPSELLREKFLGLMGLTQYRIKPWKELRPNNLLWRAVRCAAPR